MTTYGVDTICKGLQSELKSTVLKTTPSERGSERFRPYDEGVHGDLKELTARPRLFWIQPASMEPIGFGTTSRRYTVIWDLMVGYPKNGWDLCALSDVDDIRASVNTYGGTATTTGVAYRLIPPVKDAFRVERDENWMWSHIAISSIIETTDTAKTLPNYQVKTETAVTVAGSPVTLYSFTPTSDGSIAWSYHVLSSDGKTSRAGLIAASWDVSANSAVHWDESTDDIAVAGYTYANTTGLVFDVSMSGGVVYLKATSTDDTWTVRTTELSRSQE